MSQAAFDCVIRGGRVGTAIDEFDADIGIASGNSVANDVFGSMLQIVPEPGTFVLAGAGTIGICVLARRRRAAMKSA